MENPSRRVRVRTLTRAADIVGRESLRRRLNVSALLLGVWLSGVKRRLRTCS